MTDADENTKWRQGPGRAYNSTDTVELTLSLVVHDVFRMECKTVYTNRIDIFILINFMDNIILFYIVGTHHKSVLQTTCYSVGYITNVVQKIKIFSKTNTPRGKKTKPR